VVYPGAQGPIDSLRWEVFAESLQDYQVLQTFGLPREHSLLAPLRDLNDFPKQEGWRLRTRRALFQGASGA